MYTQLLEDKIRLVGHFSPLELGDMLILLLGESPLYILPKLIKQVREVAPKFHLVLYADLQLN